jgi:hypothetical protein
MATAKKRTAKRSIQVHAGKTHASRKKSRDAQFLALLRRKCLRAASVGALTAAGESVPGLSRVLGLVFGELLDAKFLAETQRQLIEETFALYELNLPKAVHDALIGKVQMLGTSASIASDAVLRKLLSRSIGRLGSLVARGVLPITSIASSAFSNAMVTYAVGKRAQAVAQLHSQPITAVPDALRAFSGVDERRVLSWTIEATKSSLASIGDALRRMTWRKPAKRTRAGRKKLLGQE